VRIEAAQLEGQPDAQIAASIRSSRPSRPARRKIGLLANARASAGALAVQPGRAVGAEHNITAPRREVAR
jgi:hypothetical protein